MQVFLTKKERFSKKIGKSIIINVSLQEISGKRD